MFLNITFDCAFIYPIKLSYHFGCKKYLVVETQTINIQVILNSFKSITVVQHVLSFDI